MALAVRLRSTCASLTPSTVSGGRAGGTSNSQVDRLGVGEWRHHRGEPGQQVCDDDRSDERRQPPGHRVGRHDLGVGDVQRLDGHAVDELDVPGDRLLEAGLRVEERLGQPANGVQRRPQLVGEVGGDALGAVPAQLLLLFEREALVAQAAVQVGGLEHVADAQQHFEQVVRLGQEVPGARVQRLPLDGHGQVGGEHDDRQRQRPEELATQALEDREAVGARHVQVEQEQVRRAP